MYEESPTVDNPIYDDGQGEYDDMHPDQDEYDSVTFANTAADVDPAPGQYNYDAMDYNNDGPLYDNNDEVVDSGYLDVSPEGPIGGEEPMYFDVAPLPDGTVADDTHYQ